MHDRQSDCLPAQWHEVKIPAVLKTKTGREIKYIRQDEVHRLLAVLEGRDRLLVEVLWNTGARISEVLELAPSSVDFNEGLVTIRTLKKKKRLPKKAKDIKNEIRGLELALKQESGSKILQRKLENAGARLSEFEKEPPAQTFRVVPIKPQLAGKIASYCMDNNIRPDDRMFKISRVRAYQILQKASETAGIEKGRAHPHIFRHGLDRKSTRLNSSHTDISRMPSSA